MKNLPARKFATLLLCAMLTTGAMPSAVAETEDVVKYRQSLMSGVGGAMGTLAAIVQGKVEYKNALADNARALHALTLHIEDAFPQGSLNDDSAAKPEIWEKWDEFQAAAQKSREASTAMVAAAESGDDGQIGAAFKALGDSCGGCHRPFRVKK